MVSLHACATVARIFDFVPLRARYALIRVMTGSTTGAGKADAAPATPPADGRGLGLGMDGLARGHPCRLQHHAIHLAEKLLVTGGLHD
jgi:hypothetical protein